MDHNFSKSRRGFTLGYKCIISLFFMILFPAISVASIINPDPLGFGDDDGSISFFPESSTYYFEVFDSLSSLGVAASFGFYRTSDPTTKITIFDGTDQGGTGQAAYADFDTGTVIDSDSSEVQDTFTPGFDPIGFFLDLPGFYTVYSDPSLNGGVDLMATFPLLSDPSGYFLGSEIPDGNGGLVTVYLALISGVKTTNVPVPVPVPATLALFGLGLVGLGLKRRSKK